MKLNPFIAKTTLQTGMMNAVVSKFCILHLLFKQDLIQFRFCDLRRKLVFFCRGRTLSK